jgi:hypothetical protein
MRPPELLATTSRDIVAKQEKLDKEIASEFCLRSISFILVGFDFFFNFRDLSNALQPQIRSVSNSNRDISSKKRK